jgi:lipopolysaccharide/colanic/teichoic acid biosynthesis glycosyltransferase
MQAVICKLFVKDLMVEQNLSASEISLTHSLRLYEAAKRITDILFSAALILVFAPVLAFVAVWVWLDSKGSIFFRQQRVGKNGRTFRIIKFRTMVMNAEACGPQVTAKHDPRITRCGRILRAWKLDELPQFINVLLGDMSLVGPRPQVPRYVELFPARQREKILSVRPGITGPTAIRFRHEEEMLQNRENREEFYIAVLLPIKCDLDEAYIDSRGTSVDFAALCQTAWMLIRGVVNRLRRIPVGETVEYPLPEEFEDNRFAPEQRGFAVVQARSTQTRSAQALSAQTRSAQSGSDEDDGAFVTALRD